MKEVVRGTFDASVSAYDAYEQRTGRFEALARLLCAELAARVELAHDLLATVEGPLEQRWRWVVGVAA